MNNTNGITDRNGKIHYSGISDPNFALDNPYAIDSSDGHSEDWSFFATEKEARKTFEEMKKVCFDMHLRKYDSDYGYDVIDSYWDEENANC